MKYLQTSLNPVKSHQKSLCRWRKRIFLKRQELSTSEQEELEQLQKRVEPRGKDGDWGLRFFAEYVMYELYQLYQYLYIDVYLHAKISCLCIGNTYTVYASETKLEILRFYIFVYPCIMSNV